MYQVKIKNVLTVLVIFIMLIYILYLPVVHFLINIYDSNAFKVIWTKHYVCIHKCTNNTQYLH